MEYTNAGVRIVSYGVQGGFRAHNCWPSVFERFSRSGASEPIAIPKNPIRSRGNNRGWQVCKFHDFPMWEGKVNIACARASDDEDHQLFVSS